MRKYTKSDRRNNSTTTNPVCEENRRPRLEGKMFEKFARAYLSLRHTKLQSTYAPHDINHPEGSRVFYSNFHNSLWSQLGSPYTEMSAFQRKCLLYFAQGQYIEYGRGNLVGCSVMDAVTMAKRYFNLLPYKQELENNVCGFKLSFIAKYFKCEDVQVIKLAIKLNSKTMGWCKFKVLISIAKSMVRNYKLTEELFLELMGTGIGATKIDSLFRRPGNVEKLKIKAKAWKLCYSFPDSIAYRVGRMPLHMRLLALETWKNDTAYAHSYKEAKKAVPEFWVAFKKNVESSANRVERLATAWRNTEILYMQRWQWQRYITAVRPEATLPVVTMLHNSIPNNNNTQECLEALRSIQRVRNIRNLNSLATETKKYFNNEDDTPHAMRVLVKCYGTDLRAQKKALSRLHELHTNAPHDVLIALDHVTDHHKLLLEFAMKPSVHQVMFRTYSSLSFSKLEQLIDNEGVSCLKWSLDKIQAEIKFMVSGVDRKWVKNVASKEFATEILSHLSHITKNEYLTYEKMYLGSLTLPELVSSKLRWEEEGITARFLPRNDVRGLFLGIYTGCCQHLTGVGKSCAIHGQTNKDGGFFVLESRDKKIIAQAWVWKSQEGGLVFDSLEGYSSSRDINEDTLLTLLRRVACDLVTDHNFTAVEVGPVYRVIGKAFGSEFTRPWMKFPKDYSGYSDAKEQRSLLAFRPLVLLDDIDIAQETKKEFVLQGIMEEHMEACLEVAKECYPASWAFVSGNPEDCMGRMLRNAEGKVVGYYVLDTVNKNVEDLALLPSVRTNRTAVKQFYGGMLKDLWFYNNNDFWRAEARESTSFKALKAMQRRGEIELEVEETTKVFMDGEPMKPVRFRLLKDPT